MKAKQGRLIKICILFLVDSPQLYLIAIEISDGQVEEKTVEHRGGDVVQHVLQEQHRQPDQDVAENKGEKTIIKCRDFKSNQN